MLFRIDAPPSGNAILPWQNVSHRPAEESEEEMVKFDLNGVFVEHIAKLVSDFTGTNFIVSEKARGTRITIMSPKLSRGALNI